MREQHEGSDSQVIKMKACPKCGGDLFPEPGEYFQEWACLQCGKRVTNEELEEIMKESQKVIEQAVPPKPTTGNLRDIKRYYDANKEQILANLAELGTRAMCEKWGIGSSTWAGLRKRWGIAPVHPRRVKAKRTPTKPEKVTSLLKEREEQSGKLPAFPEFNNDWTDRVKCSWLDNYTKLTEGSSV